MSIKKTKIWIYFRGLKNNRLKKRNYSNAKKMKECEYEQYLNQRYAHFMNKRDYTKGKTLSFENPTTFSEKSQWIKLYDQDPRKNIYSDKYEVRKYIKEMLGEDYLTPLISIDGKDCFENAKMISFDKLPNSFVLKCTHGSHMNVIVKDKTLLSKKDIKNIKTKLNKWLKIDYCYFVSLETQYKEIKPRIIIEQFNSDIGVARDYKFMCFHGKCDYFWINENCVDEKNETCTTFSSDLKVAPFNMNVGFRKNISDYSLPSNIKEMIKIAEKLSSDFSFVRVDLYNFNGKILFGEMTFNSAAGYDVPFPAKYDLFLGNLMLIDKSKRDNNYRYRKQHD